MAQKLDFTIPYNSLIQYVPQNLRNPVIKGLLDNLFDRHMTHDESIPLYGYIGRKPNSADDKSPKIPQPTVERDINAIIPVLNFFQGSTRYAFTVQDLVNRADALGISSETLEWLYSQSNNYLPPINIDKFANFYNYFWVAQALSTPPNTPWNPELRPEYYVMAAPLPSDPDKLNVLAATTTQVVRTGTGFEDQMFEVEFLSPTQFRITATASLGVYTTFGPDSTGPNEYTYTLSVVPPLPPVQPPAATGPSVSQTFTFPVQSGMTTVNLLSFTIVRDPIYDSNGYWIEHEAFVAGDTFFIDTLFLSSTYNITFSVSPGVKGKFKNIDALKTYQTIDGVLLSDGVRVLVRNNSALEDGIYIVRPQSWVRAPDYDGVNIAPGARVWAAQGTVNGGRMFTSGPGNSWSAGVLSPSNTNDWQEGNFWVHSSELEALGYTRADVYQADAPIIEYHGSLQLNSFSLNGIPGEGTGPGSFTQVKTEFNQLPMFDLFRYDGTHAGLVSSVFYYVEDLTADLDVDLQRRVKLSPSDSADYIFDHGLADPNGDLLFYKLGGDLKTIWHAGYSEVEVVDHTFFGAKKGFVAELVPTTSAIPQDWTLTALTATTFEVTGTVSGTLPTVLTIGIEYLDPQFSITVVGGAIPFVAGEAFTFTIGAGPTLSAITFVGPVKGDLTNIVPAPYTQQQIWTLRALNSTTFTVTGSKTVNLPSPVDLITVDVPYVSEEFSCLITSGTLPYDVDDTFVLRIGNLETPRYVYRDEDGAISDLYGGPAMDTNEIGAYQVHRAFIHNPYNESRDEVLEGTLYGHFRGILQNQPEGLERDYAFGGSVKNWSEQQTLLASLLMQREMTPISMIDYAQKAYETGLNSISDIFIKNIVQMYTLSGVVDPDGSLDQQQKLNLLLDAILATRALDNDVRTVLYDTTSAVTGIPITLPALGIVELVEPQFELNTLLGQTLLRHHDGHYSNLAVDDIEFRRSLIGITGDKMVLRSDGSTTPAVGSFTSMEPALPYRGELWLKPNGTDVLMYAFDVDSDATTPPTGVPAGFKWYDRNSNIVSIRDITMTSWIAQPSTTPFWRIVNFADLLNELRLMVEKRLYDGINPNARRVDFTPLLADAAFQDELRRELFTFAANNGLNPLGSDYVASNALSWNYSSANIGDFPPLTTGTVPARWQNILLAHQGTVPGVIPTERPNAEPWKLFGFSTYALWAASILYSPTYEAAVSVDDITNPQNAGVYTDGGVVRAVATSGPTTLLGSQIIDGITVTPGNIVLLQNEPDPANNGLWVVSAGVWTRSLTPLTQNTYVFVDSGLMYASTVWYLTNAVPIVNVDPVLFEQVRYWSNSMWADLQVLQPTLRLGVDTVRDVLLPPYVSNTNSQSVNALTTVYPTGIQAPYLFGEGGPVESVWKSTLEYGYSLARALFRHDPMLFLGFCWGFNWVEVDGILYDGYDVNTPGHKRFRLHGEPVREIPRSAANATITGPDPVTITYDAYEVSGGSRYQNFTVRDANGVVLGYVREGVPTTIGALSVLIDDLGQPFHIGDSFALDSLGNVTFTAAVSYKFLGFGQIFTNALRQSTIDTTDSYAIDAYRGWDVNMGHRAGGLVATDDLNVRTADDTLSTSSFDLMFKKNALAKDLWIQGLRITVSQFGTTVPGPEGGFAPKTDGSDWEFLIEGYNPRYLDISYYSLNTAGQFQTFHVLDQSSTSTIWNQYTEVTGTVDGFLPLTIVGIQNVVNFLFGYSQFLVDDGWAFNLDPTNNVDAETGRARTWQLEVEKFIDRCYRGIQAEQGHVVNPFMDKLWVTQETGLLSEFVDTSLFDITVNPGVYDISGARIPAAEMVLIRGNLQSEFGATSPMFSAHAQIDEYEHLFIMKYFVEDSIQNGLLYDPFSGSRVVTYILNGRRQAVQTFRPEFGGHYLVGDQVRQNLQASTDNITQFYDANRAFENELTTRHALALLGFNTKGYFEDLDISDKSQFNFWRGLIQSKGTNMSIAAYLNNQRFEDAKIDEYWAYKIAEYGDARQLEYPELRLNVTDTLQQFTQFQFDFVSTVNHPDPLPNFTQISRLDESRWFSIDDLDQDAYFKAEIVGSFSKTVTEGDLITLDFIADHLVITGIPTTKINGRTLRADADGSLAIVGYGPAVPKYNPVKLFNYVANELIEEIPHWHPAAGAHTPIATESINIISDLNPAKYNYSTQVVNNNTYDPLRPWGDNELGRVWFDTRNLVYIPYYDETIFQNRAERLSRWGALADFGSIDVYEWVQSSVPPSEYNALAAEQAGDADLDPATKAAGEVALEETYSRNRLWSIRPIAWSQTGVPSSNGHPAFNGSFEDQLNIETDGTMWLESATFSSFNISAGMRIGLWDPRSSAPMPRSESLVTDQFSKVFVGTPVLVPDFTVSISMLTYTELVGNLVFSGSTDIAPRIDADAITVGLDYSVNLNLQTDFGSEQIVLGTLFDPVPLSGMPTVSLIAGQTFTYDFPVFGLRITVLVNTTNAAYAGDAIQQAIVDSLGSIIVVHDAVMTTEIVPTTGTLTLITNNPDDTAFANNIQSFYGYNPVFGAAAVAGTVSNVVLAGLQTIDGITLIAGDRVLVKNQTITSENGVYEADVGAWVLVPTVDGDFIRVDSGTQNGRKYFVRLGTAFTEVLAPGWRAWSVPTQAMLTADGRQPNGSWRPFPGEYTSISASLAQVQEAVAYAEAPLTLNDGTVVDRYETTWTEWDVLENIVLSGTQITTGPLVLRHTENIDASRTSVYVNGITQLSASFTIDGTALTIHSVQAGSMATVIIRRYEPSAEELAFDPDVADDLTFQTQFKRDFEYVSLPVRDSEGSISSITYYFWVKNKNTVALGKKQSIQAVTQGLRVGPPNYLTFQNFLEEETISTVLYPNRYDAITLSGLSYVVARDDTYKLRFTRNFTLRDDPQQLDLKDTHTEWTLIRPGQRTRIPETLWQKLTDSMAGEDAAGNPVPSLRRVLYDERNGTSSQFGFGPEQTLAPQDLLVSSVTYTIVNTKLVNTSVPANPDGSFPPDFIDFLDPNQSDEWFATPAATRQTMTDIWNSAKPVQINEIFFAALNDILASNYELTDLFKTSRLSAYSIKVVAAAPVTPTYE